MKKLLFLGLLLSCFQLPAQKNLQAIDLTIGPSWQKLLGVQTGCGAGLDYSFGYANRLDMKFGLHYHESSSSLERPVREYRNKAWLYRASLRFYFNRPDTWRWYYNGEIGLIQYVERTVHPQKLGMTAGWGLGLQWLPPEQRFGIFIQPMLRILRFERNRQGEEYPVLMSAIELGLRTQLFPGE